VEFLVCLEFAINRRSLPGNYTWCAVQYGRFLPRDAMLTQYMPSSCTCPSVCVCVFVTLRYCVKTAKRRITQIVVAEFVLAEFLLTSASRGPSAIAEFLVQDGDRYDLGLLNSQKFDGVWRAETNTVVISSKSVFPLRRYCDFSNFQLGGCRNLGLLK